MIFDYLIKAIAWLLDASIGTLLRSFGDIVEIYTPIQYSLDSMKERLYLINVFLPIQEINNCLMLVGTALLLWGLFKVTMWIWELLRIGKSYQE